MGQPQGDGHWNDVAVKPRITGATRRATWFCTAARSRVEIKLQASWQSVRSGEAT